MNTRKRNRTAVSHGWLGEKEALAWLEKLTSPENIRVINTLFDFICLDTLIEVKTCAKEIKTEFIGEHRAGRFTLNALQHLKLTAHDGYYLFVVLRKPTPPLIFFVRARNINYLNQISWTTALKYREKIPNIKELAKHGTHPP